MWRAMLVVGLLVVGTPAASYQPLGNFYPLGDLYVTPEVLNERSGPSTSYTVTDRIRRGEKVIVYAWQGVWARVTDLQAQPRWVHGAYLSAEPPGTVNQGTPKVSEEGFTGPINGMGMVGVDEMEGIVASEGAACSITSFSRGACAIGAACGEAATTAVTLDNAGKSAGTVTVESSNNKSEVPATNLIVTPHDTGFMIIGTPTASTGSSR